MANFVHKLNIWSFWLETLCQGQKNSEGNFCFPRHNVFHPKGYIFLGFHPLTYHKPLHFDGFCFILPQQISLISWPIGRPRAERCGGPGGATPPLAKKWRLLKYLKKEATTGVLHLCGFQNCGSHYRGFWLTCTWKWMIFSGPFSQN